MDCQEVRNRLDAWVDGELPAPAAEGVTSHLDACPSCRRRAEALRRMTTALDRLPSLTAPAALSRWTLKAFRDGIDRPGMAEWWRGLNMAMRSAVCGAALAGLLCGAVLGTSLVTLRPEGDVGPYHTLGELLRRHQDAVYAFVCRMLGDPQEAEEAITAYAQVVAQAVQEVEDSLVTETRQGEYLARLQEQLGAAQVTQKTAHLQYMNGQDNYLDYLTPS